MDARGSIHVTLFSTLFWGCCGKAKERRYPRVIVCVAHDHGYLSWWCLHLGHEAHNMPTGQGDSSCGVLVREGTGAELPKAVLISIHF